MSGPITPTSLKSLLSQIEPARANTAARAAQPAPAQAERAGPQRTAATDPRVNVPKDAVQLNPNAPRGTYVNLTA